jgi:transposase, IS30 family
VGPEPKKKEGIEPLFGRLVFSTRKPRKEDSMPYNHLTAFERGQIELLHAQGDGPNAIARRLDRSPSTISRELRRNGDRSGSYSAERAQGRYYEVRQECVRTKSLDYLPLRQYVVDRMFSGYSPEEVSGRLWLDYPTQPRMRVSHETIYRTLYKDEKLGKILIALLRWRRPRRCKRGERRPTRPLIPNRVSIDSRPAEVDALERYGDWEGDTVLGKNQDGAILTLVERKSLLLLAAPLASKNAQDAAKAAIAALARMPTDWLRTITFDNGSEFAAHEKITEAIGTDIYFAHPYSSWERARNENTNGLLRQYYPKKTSFADLDPDTLQRVVDELNNRPRKTLGYRTPLEVFLKQTVALAV